VIQPSLVFPTMNPHQRHQRPHRRPLALLVPVALLFAACGGDSEMSSSDPSTTIAAATIGGGGGAATTEATTTTNTATTTTTTTTATTTTIVTTPAECIPGTWELRAQDFFDQIVAIAGAGGTMRHLGGRHLAVFNADGTAEGSREAWSFEVASAEGSLVTTVDATDAGTWAVDGDTITVTNQEQTFEASFEIEVGGVRQPLPFAPPNAVEAEAFGGAGTYTCDGDVLTITMTEDGITITNAWDRVAG
jgi:hypothetical protein